MRAHGFIAFRHLISRHSFSYISFISILSIIGLAIGVAVLILTLGILRGFEDEVQNKIISFDGHIRLQGFLGAPIPAIDSKRDSLLHSHPYIVKSAPFINQPAMIRYKRETEGILIEGINQEDARSVFGTHSLIKYGSFNYSDLDGIVVGEALATKLGVSVGDRITLIDFNTIGIPGNPLRLTQATIKGVYSTGLQEYDQSVVYTSLSTAQRLFDMKNTYSGVIIKTTDIQSAERVSEDIQETLGYPYYSSTWKERHFNLFAWLSIQKYPITIIFALIAIVAIVNIISSLTMIVMEKQKDIGVLRSIGYSKRDITFIFFLEGGMIGILGVLIGAGIALILGYVQMKFGIIKIPEEIYFMQILPILFSGLQVFIVCIIGFFMTLTAAMYPAWKAAGILPARAVRYE